MVKPGEVRKSAGCWGCNYGNVTTVGGETIVHCKHPDEEVRKGFEGWETALTCRGFRMTVSPVIKKED